MSARILIQILKKKIFLSSKKKNLSVNLTKLKNQSIIKCAIHYWTKIWQTNILRYIYLKVPMIKKFCEKVVVDSEGYENTKCR